MNAGHGASENRRIITRTDILKYVFILPAALWIIAFTIIPFEFVLGFLLAWFVNLYPREQNFFRPILTAPLFTMEVAIGYLGITLFTSQGGLFAEILSCLGVNIPWLSTASGGLAAAIILDIWRWTPFLFLISLAGLAAIPDHLYEAALLETSNYWQLLIQIALPLSWPVLSIGLFLRMIDATKTFGLPLALTGGGPGISTQVVSILNYYATIEFYDFGKGSAMAIVYLVFVSIAVAICFNGLRKRLE